MIDISDIIDRWIYYIPDIICSARNKSIECGLCWARRLILFWYICIGLVRILWIYGHLNHKLLYYFAINFLNYFKIWLFKVVCSRTLNTVLFINLKFNNLNFETLSCLIFNVVGYNYFFFIMGLWSLNACFPPFLPQLVPGCTVR